MSDFTSSVGLSSPLCKAGRPGPLPVCSAAVMAHTALPGECNNDQELGGGWAGFWRGKLEWGYMWGLEENGPQLPCPKWLPAMEAEITGQHAVQSHVFPHNMAKGGILVSFL